MIIGVIGGSQASPEIKNIAYEVGRNIAKRGDILICGGLSGVMEEASRGARESGGMTIGILPGKKKEESNPYIDIPIVTAMSHARNAIIVRTSDILIAIDGAYGTLSEIGLALADHKRIIGIKTWGIDGIIHASGVEDAFKKLESLKHK